MLMLTPDHRQNLTRFEENTSSFLPARRGLNNNIQRRRMRSELFSLLVLPLFAQARDTHRFSLFLHPLLDGSDIIARDENEALLLLKRENGCPAGYNSCAFLKAPGACCQRDTICSRDDANNIACCPTGADCTGRITGMS